MSRSLNHGFENKCSEETFNDIYNMAFARGKERGFDDGYDKGIDEFANKMKWEYDNSTGVPKKEIDFAKAVIDMVAEQLKGGSDDR